ncbi:MAG TPA: fused MFS/spermidine synthase [Polyangiaceae bacterium]|nr:fused MFS/spermidine synthase [Polyangiaceae bacterium]
MTDRRLAPSGEADAALARWELSLSVLLGGAVVMLVEILGTRIVGPIFGVSLFVWAALLSVTLCALAAGYYAGGVLIDRVPRASRLGWVLLLAGMVLALVPLLAPGVLRLTAGLGPRSGPLSAAFVLFAPSLAVLGMVGPITVRLATTDLASAGKRVGNIYAVSTAGSLFGTLVTSFWLIPAFDTDAIVLGASLLLVAVGALILARRRKARAAAAFAVPLLVSAAPTPSLPDDIRVLDSTHSPYGLVEVLEDRARGLRYLRADHSIIGAHWLRDHSAAFAFLHVLEVLPLMRPAAKDLLVIGLGTGALPTALAKSGIRADVVEIDPAVLRFAEQYFWFSPTGSAHVEDARTFIRNTTAQYDLIVHDTFTGGATPDHLLSVEVLHQLRARLRPGGVLALNMVGFQQGPHAAATAAIETTLRAAFPQVRAFRDSPLEHRADQTNNIIFFASDAPLDFELERGHRYGDALCADILPALKNRELGALPPGDIITDGHNPLTRLQLPVAEEHYQAMQQLLPIDVWLR